MVKVDLTSEEYDLIKKRRAFKGHFSYPIDLKKPIAEGIIAENLYDANAVSNAIAYSYFDGVATEHQIEQTIKNLTKIKPIFKKGQKLYKILIDSSKNNYEEVWSKNKNKLVEVIDDIKLYMTNIKELQ